MFLAPGKPVLIDYKLHLGYVSVADKRASSRNKCHATQPMVCYASQEIQFKFVKGAADNDQDTVHAYGVRPDFVDTLYLLGVLLSGLLARVP